MNLKKLLFTFSVVTGLTGGSWAHDHLPPSLSRNSSLAFIENKGQWIDEAKFKADIPGGVMFLTNNGFVYNFVSQKDVDRIHELTCGSNSPTTANVANEIVRYHAYRVNFVGANNNAQFKPSARRSEYHNYFLGNDASRWAGNVGLFGVVEQENVYDGIDLKVYSSNTSASLKYDFIVNPGADAGKIALSFDGVKPEITREGHLKIKTSVNEVVEKAPYTYQNIEGKEVKVASRYKFQNGVLSFEFPNGYNKAYDLIIDPDLVFATYSGGTGSSSFYSYTTTYDANGNLYAGADAWGTGWPVSTGAYQTTWGGGGHETAINKYSSDGTTLIFSTYFGGSSWDLPHAMYVNDLEELIVVGSTSSTNLPVTAGCYDNALSGVRDLYVAHFNTAGSALIGATYIGGAGEEPQLLNIAGNIPNVESNSTNSAAPVEVTIDGAGNIWVVANSNAADFPTTAGAYQSTNAGGIDGVIFKMSPDCSQLLYSSYMGGTGNDGFTAITFNNAGNIVVSGVTASSNFPTTPGAMITTAPGGTWDGFVSILNPATGAVLQSTYMGTSSTDMAEKIQVDCADNVYVMGRTHGTYPITPGAYYTSTTGNVFVDKLTPTLSASTISSRVGNGSNTSFVPTAFLVDVCGNVYIAGFNAEGGLPLTPDAYQSSAASFWFATLEPNFNGLVYGSYFGVSGDHNHIGVNRLDPDGFVYHSICNFTAYPFTSPTSYSPNKQNSGQDMLSFKFNFEANPIKIKKTSSAGGLDTATHCIRGCKSAFVEISRLVADPEPMVVKLQYTGTAVRGQDYMYLPDSIVIPPNQLSAVLEVKPLLVPAPTGMREAIINVLSPCGCDGGGDQIVEQAIVRIYDSLYVNILTPLDTVCPNTPISITAEIDTTLQFSWSPAAFNQGSLTINAIPTRTSRYSITVTQPGAPNTCPPRTQTYEIFVEPIPQISFDRDEFFICYNPGDSLDITGYAMPEGTDYVFKWIPGDYMRNDYDPVNKFLGPIGDYKKYLNVQTPVAHCESTDSILIHVVPPFDFSYVGPADTTIKYGDTVRLNTEGDAEMWVWSPGTYLNDPLAKSPLARPLTTTTYQVIGIDEFGCRDTAEVIVRVKFASDAAIPNAFTPNGDGLNDVFKIELRTFEKMTEFKIFNRLGQLVYDGIDPSKGWDGNIDGKPAAMDTYFYQIKLTFPGGEQKVFKGDVALIR
jgi:gliding motility-associated-like protein